jgi:hypothetical protein
VVVVALMATAVSACIPEMARGLRLERCTIVFYDATVATGKPSPMQPYLDELATITRARFVRGSRADAQAKGLLIQTLVDAPARTGGRTTSTYGGTRAAPVLIKAVISLRPGSSAGLRRHELGHVFNLAHNEASQLMRSVPSPSGRYSAIERDAMRNVARRAGCN